MLAMKHLITLSLITLFLVSASAQSESKGFWSPIDQRNVENTDLRIAPSAFKAYQLDYEAMGHFLQTAPMEFTTEHRTSPVIVSIPLPDGEFWTFEVARTKTMADELHAKYPDINTYLGQGIEDKTAIIKLDHTPNGFHAMILSTEKGTIYIDPFSLTDNENYVSYFKRDYVNPFPESAICHFDDLEENQRRTESPELLNYRSGDELRTYRLALACSGEYAQTTGGTVASTLAEMNTAMNRVNGVYERDVALRMVIIPNNDQIIYLNGATDPFSNFSPIALLTECQNTCDAVIGNANYDIGHVFTTGGGGVANLAVPCVTGSKARGVTGLPNPTGDPFYIDFVSHEMGHQWSGPHTFNGSSGNCSGGNRSAGSAYEPGSGSTIQAYAGICAPQNLQNNSDDYFHVKSLQDIIGYSQNGGGNSCAAITNTGNTAPTSLPGLGGWQLPIETPIRLTGSGTDPDGDALTYNWEQYDLGPAGHPNNPVGNAPIWRSWDSSTDNTRYLPRLINIVANNTVLGETYATYSRDLTFRLTVRDNRAGSGGTSWAQIANDIHDSAGPFLVTNPNTSTVEWEEETMQLVLWDVANTDVAPINCGTVNIKLATDGGFDYSTTLATGVLNSGSANVMVPAGTETDFARVMVECATNIFFDISNAAFKINPSTVGVNDLLEAGIKVYPNPANDVFTHCCTNRKR